MEDLERLTVETIIQKCQQESKILITDKKEPVNIDYMKMHTYKGFVIDPIIGGYNILLYGKKHTLYVAGPAGMQFTDNIKEARSFRNPQSCQNLIDECITDHDEWVKTLNGKPVNDLNRLDVMRNYENQQQQQQQQSQM